MSNAEQLMALLDGTLDDVADLPEFVNPNPGTYSVEVKEFGLKEVNKQKLPYISLIFKELIEAADDSKEPQTLPIETSQTFFVFDKDGGVNEFAQGQWKMFLAPLKEITGAGSNMEVMTASKGAELIVTTSLREGKNDNAGKFFLRYESVLNPAA